MKDKQFIPYTNRLMFPLVMSDPDVCRKFIERVIPDRKIREIRPLRNMDWEEEEEKLGASDSPGVNTTYEATLIAHPLSKSVRLDVLFEDEDNWYDIEMQMSYHDDIPKRCRLYHSEMDLANLAPGQGYGELKSHYVIFICSFDPFRIGEAVYEFW